MILCLFDAVFSCKYVSKISLWNEEIHAIQKLCVVNGVKFVFFAPPTNRSKLSVEAERGSFVAKRVFATM